jgi:hypothetical protein
MAFLLRPTATNTRGQGTRQSHRTVVPPRTVITSYSGQIRTYPDRHAYVITPGSGPVWSDPE